MFGWVVDTPAQKYLFCLGFVAVFALLAKNLVRSHIGREWMAMRDMDVAASVIGIRPVYAKLTAFAVSSFFVGVAGALWGFVYLGAWEPAAFNIDRSFQLLFMVIIGGLGSIMGSFFGAAFIVIVPILLDNAPILLGIPIDTATRRTHVHDLRRADRVLPDRRAARPGAAVVDRQGEAAAVAVPALTASPVFPRRPRVPPLNRLTTWRQHEVEMPWPCAPGRRRLAVLTSAPARAGQGSVLPGAVYRTGAYAPNGVPFANGYVDYLKLINAKGGINGVKVSGRSAKPATPPTRASSATSA